MTSLAPLSGPIGAAFRNEDVRLKAAGGAIAIGTLVTLSSANVDHPLIFDTATASTAVDGTASDLHLMYGVAVSAATAAGDMFTVRVKGVVAATTGGGVADADTLIAGAGTLVTGAAEASADKAQKVIAVALETDVGTTANVLIDGINGFGSLPVT